MPTYEYECQKCGHRFDHFQSITAEPLTSCLKESCPQAKGRRGKVKRLIGTGGGLLFKGSGFYITDYRSEGYKSAQKADTKSGGDGGDKSATKTETKTETKKAD